LFLCARSEQLAGGVGVTDRSFGVEAEDRGKVLQPPLTSPTTLENVVPLPQIPTGDPRVLAVSHTDR
jgi:hypothetical protein